MKRHLRKLGAFFSFWLLVTGCWILVTGCWRLVVGSVLNVVSGWLLNGTCCNVLCKRGTFYNKMLIAYHC